MRALKAIWWSFTFVFGALWEIFVPSIGFLFWPITWPVSIVVDWWKLGKLTRQKARLERDANERADREIADLERIQREVQ